MRNPNANYFRIFVCASFLSIGCFPGYQPGQEPPVVGQVRDGKVALDLEESYMVHGQFEDPNYPPIPNAIIYLAFDSQGRKPIEGFRATSDAKGWYRLEIRHLPPPQGPRHYLVVEKKGYSRFIGMVVFSPYSNDRNNTVVLLPQRR